MILINHLLRIMNTEHLSILINDFLIFLDESFINKSIINMIINKSIININKCHDSLTLINDLLMIY